MSTDLSALFFQVCFPITRRRLKPGVLMFLTKCIPPFQCNWLFQIKTQQACLSTINGNRSNQENSHRHRENTQTPCKKPQASRLMDSNTGPSCCEVTVQTTAPLCSSAQTVMKLNNLLYVSVRKLKFLAQSKRDKLFEYALFL